MDFFFLEFWGLQTKNEQQNVFLCGKNSQNICLRKNLLDKKFVALHGECKHVNNFCFIMRDRLDEVFQKKWGMKRSQNMSNKEKTALKALQRNIEAVRFH